jgi:hypothetical protein
VQPETRYASNDGVRIAYQVTGDGAFDLAFVSGFVSHAELWDEEPTAARFFNRLASFSRPRAEGVPGEWKLYAVEDP